MRIFQGIAFKSTQTYMEIFKSVLLYLSHTHQAKIYLVYNREEFPNKRGKKHISNKIEERTWNENY